MNPECSSCGSADTTIIYSPSPENLNKVVCKSFTPTSADFGIFYKLARCRKCGMHFAVLDDKWADSGEMYRDASDVLYLSQEQDRSVAYKKIISELKKVFPSGGRILDVGCSYGFLPKVAKESGFSVFGVEASLAACEYCRKQGLEVFSGSLQQANFASESFDIVCAIEVIEHFSDIRGFISEVFRILKPGGIFYVVTPDIESLSGRIMGQRFWSYRKMHLQYFSRKTIYNFLKRNGFAIIKSSVYRKVFRLGYALDQLSRSNYSKVLCYFLNAVIKCLGLNNLRVTASFGDIAVIARKRTG